MVAWKGVKGLPVMEGKYPFLNVIFQLYKIIDILLSEEMQIYSRASFECS
jgi:hypothetical protein